jgi:capsular polysaccharide export protein
MSGEANFELKTQASSPQNRRVLFLQGPLSPFFRLAGKLLEDRGLEVFRINFCAGDWLHWHGNECTSFKGKVSDWSSFIEGFLSNNKITDLVLHGDQRIYHRIAIEKARQHDVQIAVTELGALRPGWMTLEKNGLSTLSHFPCDPEEILEVAKGAGEVDLTPFFPSSFWLQTGPDIAYNFTNVFLKPLFPNYERHTIYPPIEEYLRGAIRLLSEKKRKIESERVIRNLQDAKRSYFLMPLQLEGDFQLRRHSPFESFADVLDKVFCSFAREAPGEAHLVLKSHPLDVGFEDWPSVSSSLVSKYGLKERVNFLDGGGLAKPFEAATGLITVNSTAGLEAIRVGVPVKTLVPAHYDIAGLTHQGDLDSFWNQPVKPNPETLEIYIRALAAATQIRGSIHNRDGVKVAAINLANRIENRELNSFGAFVDPPPRLEAARKLGVPL